MEMRPQQNPGFPCTPPRGPSRGAPPHSGSAFPTAADVSEQPSVTLDEWWLARVEGQERRIAVAGFFERKKVLHFIDAPIAKRYDPCTLETDDGTLLFIYGFFNAERTLDNGYSIEACEKFLLGFPHWWENWNVRYPKMMSSQTESQPISSRSSNLVEDSNVPSASMVEYNNYEGMVRIDSASRINEGCQKRRGRLKKLGKATAMQSSEKGKQPVGSSRKQRSAFGKLHHATKSPTIISPIPYGNLVSPLTRGKAQSFSVSTPESLKLKKTRSGRVIVPPLNSGCQNIIYDQDGLISVIVGLNSPSPLKGRTSKTHVKKERTH